jgi:hypothetical protein
MNCVEWEARVALHSGGDLTGAEAAEVERHLAGCSGCQAFWSDLRASLAVLRTAHADAPTAAHFTAVRSRVMAELERTEHPWRRVAWISVAAALAALLLLVALRPAHVVPEAPRRLASVAPQREPVPVAPVVRHVVRHVVRPAVRRVVEHTPPRAPLTIKYQTADPNIVIYWIAD